MFIGMIDVVEILFLSTFETLSAYKAPSLELITSKDLPCFERFNDHKNWKVQVLNRVELVFGVGQQTGSVTVMCLLGYKLHLLTRDTSQVSPKVLSKEVYNGVQNFLVDVEDRRLYLFGMRKPLVFRLSWSG